jgi:hypothetical protein
MYKSASAPRASGEAVESEHGWPGGISSRIPEQSWEMPLSSDTTFISTVLPVRSVDAAIPFCFKLSI